MCTHVYVLWHVPKESMALDYYIRVFHPDCDVLCDVTLKNIDFRQKLRPVEPILFFILEIESFEKP